jgi:hypothetical protein
LLFGGLDAKLKPFLCKGFLSLHGVVFAILLAPASARFVSGAKIGFSVGTCAALAN